MIDILKLPHGLGKDCAGCYGCAHGLPLNNGYHIETFKDGRTQPFKCACESPDLPVRLVS